MILDCAKRVISEGDEFVVSIGDLIYHGIQLDENEYPEYIHTNDEDILIIECFCEHASNELCRKVISYNAPKDQERILPNILIYNKAENLQ